LSIFKIVVAMLVISGGMFAASWLSSSCQRASSPSIVLANSSAVVMASSRKSLEWR
jgi:hypothetical protein